MEADGKETACNLGFLVGFFFGFEGREVLVDFGGAVASVKLGFVEGIGPCFE